MAVIVGDNYANTITPWYSNVPGYPSDNIDHVFAGGGNDYVELGGGDDFVLLQEGDDYAGGGAGNDLLYGGEGNDWMNTGEGYNAAFGEGGNDYIIGGNQPDNLGGGNGDDAIFAYDGADLITGDFGNDFVDAGMGNDTVHGGFGNDDLNGGLDDDVLIGNPGNDRLYGGWEGVDGLWGYEGGDVFVFDTWASGAPGEPVDVVGDFHWWEGDKIDLSATNATSLVGYTQTPGDGQIGYWFHGNNTMVTWNEGGHVSEIMLADLQLYMIEPDFIL